LIAAVVGLAMAVPLYLVGSMLTEKFELVHTAQAPEPIKMPV
jgi:hypothetical protein